MDDNLFDELMSSVKQVDSLNNDKHRLIVMVTTSNYLSGNKMVSKRELYPLKRKSQLSFHDMFPDPIECMNSITNFHEVDEGIYEVIMINESRDWETGYLDDWEYKLIPYKE